MADQNQSTIKLRFADDFKSPTLEVGQGDYVRKFDAKDQPFECSKQEAEMLLRTKNFVVAEAATDSAKNEALPKKPGVVSGLKSAGKIGGSPAPTE